MRHKKTLTGHQKRVKSPRPHGKHENKRDKPRKLYLFSVVFALLLTGVVWWLIHLKESKHGDQAQELQAKESQGSLVSVAQVKAAPSTKELTLIGETRPFAETTVYAKLSGYLKNVFVDKGDLVKPGQPLAIIESPETDMAYLAAKADAYNKKRIAARMRFLVRRKLVSAQEAEQAIAAADIAQAQLQTQSVLKGYEIMRAPFAGMVVARYVDPGMLIQNAANGQAASLAVVTVSEINILRIYVYVEQRDAEEIHVGLPVEIALTNRPELKLFGQVTRVPQELDPRTRTLLAEIDFDNSRHQLIADSYVQVKIRVNTPPTLEVPSSALVYSGAKAYLPVVDQGHLAFKEAQVIEDDGVTVRFVSDANVGTPVAMNVGQTMASGDPVRTQQPQTMQANAGQDSGKGSSASGTDQGHGSAEQGEAKGSAAGGQQGQPMGQRQLAQPRPTQDTTGQQSLPGDGAKSGNK